MVSDAERVVGRYEILREIGRGGMATVHLARQPDLDRLVALKELRALRTDDPSFAQRFLREAKLAGSLSHPNIVTVHDYFEHEAIPYIAMEYLPRGSLRPYIGRLSPARIGFVLEGLLAGLSEAERHGVVHRDIKPENLLVTGEGSVKIADFGIAKAANVLEQTGQLTATGLTVGTPSYIAPEQAMARELGPWTDLYAVGITAFEMITGRTPFSDTKEAMAIVLRHVNEPIPPVTDLVPNVDPWIARWVAWLAAKNPAERPQSAAQAWDALDETLLRLLGPRWRRDANVKPTSSTTTPPAPAPTRPRPAADPRLAATIAPRRQRPRADVAPAVPPRARRKLPSRTMIGLLVALIGVVGALAGTRGGSSPAPAAPVSQNLATLPASVGTTQPQAVTNTGASVAPTGTVAPTTTAAPATVSPTRTVAATTTGAPTRTVAPSPTTVPVPVTQAPGGCAGDSASDDPSDDSCSP
jgi:tRNA A-37 threonylcarbamoyl transferase component Bud32